MPSVAVFVHSMPDVFRFHEFGDGTPGWVCNALDKVEEFEEVVEWIRGDLVILSLHYRVCRPVIDVW